MNQPTHDELSSLEAELASLRPAQPPRALRTRIARSIEPQAAEPATGLAEWRPLAQAAAVVLTVATIAFSIEGGRSATPVVATTSKKEAPATTNEVSRLQPVESVQYVLSADNEGMVELPDGSFARLIRTRSVQHFELEDPTSRARLSYALPREDVLLVAVDAF